MRDFMNAIGELYLKHFQFHLEDAKISMLDFQENMSILVKQININVNEVRHALVTANEWAEPWETACWARTNIEAFQEMFGSFGGKLDAGEIAEYMEALKGDVSADSKTVPENAPSGHWWWFAQFE